MAATYKLLTVKLKPDEMKKLKKLAREAKSKNVASYVRARCLDESLNALVKLLKGKE